MKTVLSIDPGMESGFVVAKVTEDALPEILWKGQVGGGLDQGRHTLDTVRMTFDHTHFEVTCESFSPRPGARSWRLEELEPLRWEGYLAAWHPQTAFRRPESRKLINGELGQTAEFLKSIGYWTLPSQVGRPDANDVNSAMMHLFGYLRDKAHMPTIEAVISYGDQLHGETE